MVIVAQKVMMQMFLPTNSIQSDTFMQPFFVFVILLSDLAFLMGFGSFVLCGPLFSYIT